MRGSGVIVGGLAAGLLINLSGLVEVRFVLGRAYVEALLSHLPHPAGPGTFLRHLGIRFGLGILSVLLYAALRPSFASLAPAAAAAGGFLFCAGYLPLSAMLNELGILTGWRLWVALIWSAGEAFAGTLIGAFLFDKLTP